MTEDEAENAYEDEEMFVVLPQNLGIIDTLSYKLPEKLKKTEKKEYSSKGVKLLTKEEIRSLLTELNFE
ncbi:MAG TPA: hypothetical protein C5S37_06920 [Methanophagales archaeon]|nr:hypothetical protein [Methanophagales archaeon]